VAAAKFIPGFSVMVPPLAGILRMPMIRFLTIDGAASIAWSGAAVMAGFVYGQRVLPHVVRAQRAIGVLAGAAVVGFVAWKLYERRWLVRHYSVARVGVDELRDCSPRTRQRSSSSTCEASRRSTGPRS